jgi:hypothetical protein
MDTHKYWVFVCPARVFALFSPITLSDTELSISLFFRLQKLYFLFISFLRSTPTEMGNVRHALDGSFGARKLQKCCDECLQTMRTFYQTDTFVTNKTFA